MNAPGPVLQDCIITSATSSILACQLPAHGRAGNSTVQIRSSLGLAEHQGDGAPFQIAYPLAIDDVIHKGLALGGGATVTLQGPEGPLAGLDLLQSLSRGLQ